MVWPSGSRLCRTQGFLQSAKFFFPPSDCDFRTKRTSTTFTSSTTRPAFYSLVLNIVEIFNLAIDFSETRDVRGHLAWPGWVCAAEASSDPPSSVLSNTQWSDFCSAWFGIVSCVRLTSHPRFPLVVLFHPVQRPLKDGLRCQCLLFQCPFLSPQIPTIQKDKLSFPNSPRAMFCDGF